MLRIDVVVVVTGALQMGLEDEQAAGERNERSVRTAEVGVGVVESVGIVPLLDGGTCQTAGRLLAHDALVEHPVLRIVDVVKPGVRSAQIAVLAEYHASLFVVHEIFVGFARFRGDDRPAVPVVFVIVPVFLVAGRGGGNGHLEALYLFVYDGRDDVAQPSQLVVGIAGEAGIFVACYGGFGDESPFAVPVLRLEGPYPVRRIVGRLRFEQGAGSIPGTAGEGAVQCYGILIHLQSRIAAVDIGGVVAGAAAVDAVLPARSAGFDGNAERRGVVLFGRVGKIVLVRRIILPVEGLLFRFGVLPERAAGLFQRVGQVGDRVAAVHAVVPVETDDVVARRRGGQSGLLYEAARPVEMRNLFRLHGAVVGRFLHSEALNGTGAINRHRSLRESYPYQSRRSDAAGGCGVGDDVDIEGIGEGIHAVVRLEIECESRFAFRPIRAEL